MFWRIEAHAYEFRCSLQATVLERCLLPCFSHLASPGVLGMVASSLYAKVMPLSICKLTCMEQSPSVVSFQNVVDKLTTITPRIKRRRDSALRITFDGEWRCLKSVGTLVDVARKHESETRKQDTAGLGAYLDVSSTIRNQASPWLSMSVYSLGRLRRLCLPDLERPCRQPIRISDRSG